MYQPDLIAAFVALGVMLFFAIYGIVTIKKNPPEDDTQERD